MNNHQIKQFLENKRTPLYPFDRPLIQFCEQLSQVLLTEADTQHHPELIALAFWLRKGHLADLQENFQQLSRPNELIVPRGLAFHIAPANVETLFVYSWILSMLVGNVNIVRLPSRQSSATKLLFSILQRLLEKSEFAEVAETTLLLSYGHESEITEMISAHSDVRLIWGGDATIEAIRKLPIKVMGKELFFADRYAFAAIRASYYLEADQGMQQRLADFFYRDLFWYDQQTCASPRVLFWIGSQEICHQAGKQLYQHLQKIAEGRGYTLSVGGKLSKLTDIYRASIELPLTEVNSYGPLTVVELKEFHPKVRTFGGFGLLFHVVLQEIEQIADCVIQKDQTLTHAGFSADELRLLAKRLNGKGLDRIVPLGRALQFEAVWDGYDLFTELTRRVVIADE